ncbi:MAG: NHLP bacteriocin export ABC transporter permease/ATPase subunit [Nostoc sp. DedQUE04]|uniref:NHLP bacteriocin export ABC transporter permease/ATPase subunit n=1 Tax=Nostoc sp. DedQUE04 TaxID=3075390 RepID=UPI002AD416DE|nr:NHLP bacteriocin export ABC transporter permease/ATPase subunit [Nostoc sp. DedQUE04]MDZ8139794.1 NHLP bacteriocin export ABC transporter permease/ATPase subunit [Nostoc sp. DedQUE04]
MANSEKNGRTWSNNLNYSNSETIVKGNNPLKLARSDTAWLILSGTMALFAVGTANGIEQGARRYLFDINPADVIFGIPVNLEGNSYSLIAIGYEETHLQAVDLTNCGQYSLEGNESLSPIPSSLRQWSNRLVAVFDDTDIVLDGIKPEEISGTAATLERLQQFHSDFLRCLHELEQQEEKTRFQQFNARSQLNQQASERALGELTSIFRPQEAEFLQEGTELLIAVGAVGRTLGIEIRPPARSEDPKRVKDPLEAIARASRIRTRRVILSGKWWESDSGPLLAYTAQGDRPVALLPVGSDRYEVFSPHERRRIPVNIDTARLISPIAYMFYRPFPERVLKTVDIIKFALRGRDREILTVLVLGVISALLGMLTPQATGILIDKAIPDANRGILLQIGLGLLAVSFGNAVFNLVQNIAIARIETVLEVQNQAAVWDRLLKLRVSFFRKYSTGDLQSRVSAIAQIHKLLSSNIIGTIFSSFFALLNLGLLFVYSSQLALVALAIALINFLATTISSIFSRRIIKPMQELQGEIFGLTVELLNGVSKLRVAAAEERAFAYWSKGFSQQLKLMLKSTAIADTVTVINQILPTISSILIFSLTVGIIMHQLEGGAKFSTGTFLAFNSAFGIFIGGATKLSNAIVSVSEVAVLWERAQPILTELPEVDLNKSDPGRLEGGVKFARVNFRYREDGLLTLDKVSIEAKPGEFIALVGPSGSGKSTIVRLLLGFEQPEDGTIYYDGQDLSGLDISAIRRQLGVVLQNGRINSASIFENISSGALVTMDEAWEAARMAGFAADIEQMPMGMHTVISEGGSNLSGGQRQRLLIARSLVLKPRILIFDEATSALDNRTQAIVSQSLEQLKVTRIAIAHRLSTIRNADRIYVIAAGQVMQQGTFDKLMAQPGIFADLMARQVA